MVSNVNLTNGQLHVMNSGQLPAIIGHGQRSALEWGSSGQFGALRSADKTVRTTGYGPLSQRLAMDSNVNLDSVQLPSIIVHGQCPREVIKHPHNGVRMLLIVVVAPLGHCPAWPLGRFEPLPQIAPLILLYHLRHAVLVPVSPWGGSWRLYHSLLLVSGQLWSAT